MRFNLSKEKHESLKEYFVALLHGGVRFDEFFALSDVSFDIMPGDFYGLIGLNGSGKSTLLKVISGVYKPSAGKVTVNGTIAPLIELGAGFDMDLTARENIYLNGTVLGYTPKYIDSKFDDIVEFSELQDFLDVPLKNYSSGMVARLAFAVATITKPDILIADEILSVGDFLFQEKCEKRMAELLSGGTTVILVSHSIDQIERPADLAVQDSVGGMARRLLNPAHLRDLAGRSVKTLREQGVEQLWRDVKFRVGLAMHHDDWRHRADIPLRRELKAQRAAHLQGPKISIIVPLYNTPAKLFDEMLQSVVRQTYTNWELVLVDASDADKRLERRLPKAVPGTIVYEPIENGGIALKRKETLWLIINSSSSAPVPAATRLRSARRSWAKKSPWSSGARRAAPA